MVEEQIQADVRGGIFEFQGKRVYDPANPVPGTLTVNVANGSGEWIDLIFESVYPNTHTIWQSGRLEDSQSASDSRPLLFHVGANIHIKRWRPGLFRIPGDGGGEVFFELPHSGDVIIDIVDTG